MGKHRRLLRPGLRLRIFVGLLGAALLFSFSSWLFPSTVLARSALASPLVDFQLDIGFNATFRLWDWVPVHITFSNNMATSFRGSVEVMSYNGIPQSNGGAELVPTAQRYTEAVTVPSGGKQMTLYMPFNGPAFKPYGIMANLRDSHGTVIATHNQDVFLLNQGSISLALLSDRSQDFRLLQSIYLPKQAGAIHVTALDASTLPALTRVLEGYEVIMLDDFASRELKADQLSALQTWVNQGGVLIEIGGPDWDSTLSPLPADLLPVSLRDSTELAAGTHLLPGDSMISDDATKATQAPFVDTVSAPVEVSRASLRGETGSGSVLVDETVLASDNGVPLFVQAHQGQGVICYLAFDPVREPLADWPGQQALWQHLLQSALGDQLFVSTVSSRFASGPGALLARGGILATLEPDTGVSVWLLVLLLLGYIALLGPLRLLAIHFLKRRHRADWSWRIVVSGIIVFSLLSYELAFYQRSAALIDNSFSVMQINQSGSAAHTTTYMGIFVPKQGDFTVRLPGVSLAQPINYPLYEYGPAPIPFGDATTPISYDAQGTNVALLNSGQWTTHQMVVEQDQQLHGSLVTHLTLHETRLTGTISNTLGTALSDVYVLMPHRMVFVGNLLAGKTRQIDLPLQSTPAETALADQIARSNGLPAGYFPYQHNQQPQAPQTTLQRHIAQLAALNGTGYTFSACEGPCIWRTFVNVAKNEIVMPIAGALNMGITSGGDPLLLDGSPATLVGWTQQALDGMDRVTINGSRPQGQHDNLVQMPLNLSFASAASITPDLLPGHIVSTPGNEMEMILPNIYAMYKGSMNFEFTLPSIADTQIKGFTITAHTLADASDIQARLYNWKTGSWDAFALDHSTLSTSSMERYSGPNGRVLLQISNRATSQGLIFINKPWLNLR